MADLEEKLEALATRVEANQSRVTNVLEHLMQEVASMSAQMKNKAPITGNSDSYEEVHHQPLERRTDFDCRFKRGDLPVFSGYQPEAWLKTVERFFRLHPMADHDKLHLLAIHMDDAARTWFIHTEESFGMATWLDFKNHFEGRYALAVHVLHRQLFEVQQRTSVSAYRTEFEEIIIQLPLVAPEIKESAYLRGLFPEIRTEVLRYRPYGLREIMDLSLRAEADLGTLYRACQSVPPYAEFNQEVSAVPRTNTIYPPKTNTYSSNQAKAPNHNPTPQIYQGQTSQRISQNDRAGRRRNVRITDSEYQQRKDKGLCYYCNDKFTPGHWCRRNLNLILVREGDENGGPMDLVEEDDLMQTDEDPITEGALFLARVNLRQAQRHSATGALKLWGSIKGSSVVVLIDGGATHNFINPAILNSLDIPITAGPRFDVQLGDGYLRSSQGVCLNVNLYLQGLDIVQDFFPLSLGRFDVILGVHWLKTLDWFYSNYRLLTLKLLWNNRIYTLQSDPEFRPYGETTNLHPQELLRNKQQFRRLHALCDPNQTMVFPDCILSYRFNRDGIQVLVKWKKLPNYEATWEDVNTIKPQFPSFPIGDQLVFGGGSNDKIPLKTYQSKKRRAEVSPRAEGSTRENV
ncbi:uncharacterized protein LOC144716044 [Wolffia australiana]